MRNLRLIFYMCLTMAALCLLVFLIAGPRGRLSRRPPLEFFPDMNRQPKLRPQNVSDFFADGRTSRLPVPGTIAQEDRYQDTPENTGKVPGTTNFVETIPVPVTAKLMERGHQRFNINCSPCHGQQADGNGVLKKLGLPTIANLQDKRIIEMPDGEIFNTITYGKNTMMPYGANVPIEDRWAIISYLRALQLSRLGTVDDVPEQYRPAFQK